MICNSPVIHLTSTTVNEFLVQHLQCSKLSKCCRHVSSSIFAHDSICANLLSAHMLSQLQFSLYSSPISLVLWVIFTQKFWWVPPEWGVKRGWGEENELFPSYMRQYLENDTRYIQSYYCSLIGSCICAFEWHQDTMTLDDLELLWVRISWNFTDLGGNNG